MAKSKNHVIYDDDFDKLKRLAEEYRSIGRDVEIEQGKLIVLAYPRKKPKKENNDSRRTNRKA